MFPEKPGVMAARELTADDVRLQLQPPRQEPEEDRRLLRSRREGRGAPTRTPSCSHSRNYNAEWDYRFGWGYYSGIDAEGGGRRRRRQLEERERHRPVHAHRLRAGQLQHLREEPASTGTRRRSAASSTSCPFVDKLVYRTIKDEATFVTALRTGQARHAREHPLAERRAAEEERAAAASGRSGSTCRGTVPGHARRHQAVRRHPRAPRAQHGGQQAGDRLAPTTTATPSCSPIRSTPTTRLLRAAGGDAGQRQGAVRLQSRQGQEAAGRSRRIPTASASRCRSARAIPTTWTCCRWSPPTSRRSASRSRSSRWSTARSSRR